MHKNVHYSFRSLNMSVGKGESVIEEEEKRLRNQRKHFKCRLSLPNCVSDHLLAVMPLSL